MCCALRLYRIRRANACTSDGDGDDHTAAQTNDGGTGAGNTTDESVSEEFDGHIGNRADALGYWHGVRDCCFWLHRIWIRCPGICRPWLYALVPILSHCRTALSTLFNGILVRSPSLSVRFAARR